MKRKPEHYPEWLRKLLYDPLENMRNLCTSDPERNWNTLRRIQTFTYRTDPKDALIFDMIIEIEKNEIARQTAQEYTMKHLRGIREEIDSLKTQLADIEENPLTWMRRRTND